MCPGPSSDSTKPNRRIWVYLAAFCVLGVVALALGLGLGLSNKNDSDATAATSWPHENSDIPPDPKVRYGKLENGFRYMILPNDEPPEKLSLRLHVDAGSLMEEDDQQGLAHFLEHMLFNGLRNFSPDELVPKMQRLGIAWGSHANAYTSFDETVYMLDLPNTEEDTLGLCFTVMRDYADGALLLEDEIEKERGVVLSEKIYRESASYRMWRRQVNFFLPDHLLTKRFPIGIDEVISTAPRERFDDFYSRYYIPERLTFIAVGDMDADALEERIIEAFQNMTNPENPGEEPVLEPVPVGTGFRTGVFTDKELTEDELFLSLIRPYEPQPDTESVRIAAMPLWVANYIMRRRFEIIAKEEGSPIVKGDGGLEAWYDAVAFVWIEVTPVDGRWGEAVMVLEQEYRRALEHGFTYSEFLEAKAYIMNYYEEQVESAPTRQSDYLASQLVDTVNWRRVFSTPEEELRIAQKGFKTMSLDSIHDAFTALWNTADVDLVLATKESSENMKERLETLYAESEALPVTPPVDFGNVTFAYTDFGAAGTVVSDLTHEDLDIRQLILSNNVRVNMKQTNFEENNIWITASFGTGKLGQPKTQPGLAEFTETLMNRGGLGNHSADELVRILAGKSVGVQLSVSDDAFLYWGSTTPEDLELQLQLMVASISDPGYREEAVRQFRQNIPAVITKQKHDLSGAISQMRAWLRGGDGRFAAPTKTGLMALEASQAIEWIQPQLDGSYLEVSIVGDFDENTAIPLLLETFGALPMRANSTDTEVERDIAFPETPGSRAFMYESDIPKAAAVVVWEITPIKNNTEEARRLDILTRILTSRMREKIREELGASYGPSAYSDPSESFDFGAIYASAIGLAPDETMKVSTIIVDIAENLAMNGASKNELARALEPVLADHNTTLRSNTYWLDYVLYMCQAEPYKLDWVRERSDFFSSINLQDINDLARKYLMPESALRIRLLPEVINSGASEDIKLTSRSIGPLHLESVLPHH